MYSTYSILLHIYICEFKLLDLGQTTTHYIHLSVKKDWKTSKCNYCDNNISLSCVAGFRFCCALTLIAQRFPPEILLLQDMNFFLNGKSKENPLKFPSASVALFPSISLRNSTLLLFEKQVTRFIYQEPLLPNEMSCSCLPKRKTT